MKMDFIQSTYLQEVQIHKEIVISQVLLKFHFIFCQIFFFVLANFADFLMNSNLC